jgi:hypothetical protein
VTTPFPSTSNASAGSSAGRTATAADRRLAALLLFGPAVAEFAPPPKGISQLELLRFHLSSDAFLINLDAKQRDGLKGWSEVRSWARGLPLTEAGLNGVDEAIDREEGLSALFSDPQFLSAVIADQTFAFSPGELVLGPPASEEDRAFVAHLVKSGSALVDRHYLARWGLERIEDPDELVRYGRLPWFVGTPLFDANWYSRQRGRAFDGWFGALRDYVEVGEARGLSPNPFIDPAAYVTGNADVMVQLRAEGRSCWLEHLAQRDAVELRSAACHFDAGFYGAQVSPKAWRVFGSPLAHYVATGCREGLSPNPCFDALWYLRTYPDALRAVGDGDYPNAFSHFVLAGGAAGLRPSPFFDAEAYADCNADLKDAKDLDLFRHFWSQGWREQRDVGAPVPRAAVRAFQKRLPTQSDLVGTGGLTTADTRPGAVTAAAKRPVAGNLVDLILSGQGSEPARRGLIEQAITELGRPQVRIEHGGHQQVHAGDVIRLYASGEASMGGLPLVKVRAVSPLVARCGHFTHISLAQVDVAAHLGGGSEALRSGFMAWFEFSARDLEPGVQRVNLEFIFTGAGGVELVANETVTIQVMARPQRSLADAPVQVAMASYNPPRDPFRRQVDSILANPGTHLVISDDASPARGASSLGQFVGHPRVDIDVNPINTGFIINFERSLYMCSAAAGTILFSDQDDLWRADKVATLVDALKGEDVICAFSDMRITTDDGEVISPTFWNSRRVHHFDALAVGAANTVTGAASAFPADLVDMLAPFPRYTSGLYHDQWLAVLSAAAGRIAYVDKPLYDYVQHGANVLGFTGSRLNDTAKWSSILRRLKRVRRTREATEQDVELVALSIGQVVGVMQRFVMWREALLRVPAWVDPEVRGLAEQACAAIAGAPFDAVRLKRGVARLARRAGGGGGLLAIDALIESLILARHLIETGIVDAGRLSHQRQAAATAARGFQARISDKGRTDFERKVEGLPALLASSPVDLRLNLFLPELTLRHFFGGYHSKISLITRLRERGVATRLVLVDEPRVNADAVSEIVGAFPELERGLVESEIEAIGLRDRSLAVGPGDALMATTWWSALVVNDLRRQLGRERFLYFIQEYEPFTFSLGTWYRAAEQTYELPHDAIFSTEVLERFFRDQKAGVFADGAASRRSLPFRNPITGLRGMPRRELTSGRRPRLLFYARPQATEARNMYDFGLAALRLAAAELGPALDGWDLVGVGSDRNAILDIGSGRSLRLIKKLDSYSYREMLASSDVGLSLMYTPHPSLVPLEMAAAGMVTVTNACMSKTADAFAGVSPLIRVAEPDIQAIASQLVAAFREVMAGPVSNPGVDWPVSPLEAFPEDWLDRFIEMARLSTATSPEYVRP